jgi:hypothetical protein
VKPFDGHETHESHYQDGQNKSISVIDLNDVSPMKRPSQANALIR